MNEEIKLKREVEAVAIPAGTTKKLPAGTEVIITQDLGGTFTVHTPHEGGLFRIQGKDADALGKKVSTETRSTSGTAGEDGSGGFKVTGTGKQNLSGGQLIAFNIGNEAQGKAQKAISRMKELAA